MASLTDDDNENKTAEEIEAEERARLAGENVAGVLEIVRLVAEAVTNQSDAPLEAPVLKMKEGGNEWREMTQVIFSKTIPMP